MSHQHTPMKFNPVHGPTILSAGYAAAKYREEFPDVVWKYNPWTGAMRSAANIETDPCGCLIVPPGEEVAAAEPTEWVEWAGGSFHDLPDFTGDVLVRFRGGQELDTPVSPMCLNWAHKNAANDIVAYKVVEDAKPALASAGLDNPVEAQTFGPLATVSLKPHEPEYTAGLALKAADGKEFHRVGDAKYYGVISGRYFSDTTGNTDANGEGKQTNPKDLIGARKAKRSVVPAGVILDVGNAMLEGACKYGRHNYRYAGVRASIYYDAASGHLDDWWEGQDIDPDSGLNHVTKAIASLVVLRDAMMQDMLEDDRPPRSKVHKQDFNAQAAEIIDRHADKNPRHFTIADTRRAA